MDFKNRFPMYEGDGYIHPSPVQFPTEVPSQSENHVHRARQDSPKPAAPGGRRSAGAKHRALLNLPRSHRKARTTWR